MIGLFVTQSGPGISPDSEKFIVVGENIYHGNGFHANRYCFSNFESTGGRTYTNQAPLYPLSIAGLMHLGLDREQAARSIPVLSFALLMFPLFFLGKTISDVFTGYVACLIILLSQRLQSNLE